MKTLTEKYRGVLNESFSKKQFVRDARMAWPQLITQFNGFEDTVSILKQKGMISEEDKSPKYSDYDNLSDDAIRRGMDVEIAAHGHDPANCTDPEVQAKAKEKAIKNLKKDPLHYINLLSGESNKVDKHDQMVDATSKNTVDTFNGMKKADLKEEVDHKLDPYEDKKEIVRQVIDLVKKEKSVPTSVAVDFVKTHYEDILNAHDDQAILDEFEEFYSVNYEYPSDYMQEQPNEVMGVDRLGHEKEDDDEVSPLSKAKETIWGQNEALSDDEMKAIEKYGHADKTVKPFKPGDMWSKDFDYEGMLEFGLKIRLNTPIATLQALFDSFEDVNYHSEGSHLSYAIDAIKDGDKSEALDHIRNFKKEVKKTLVGINEGADPSRKKMDEAEAVVSERVGGLEEFISLIKDRANDFDGDEIGAAEEVVEAIGDHYGFEVDITHHANEAKGKDHDGDGDIDGDDYMAAKDKAIKKAMGKDEVVKEHIKNIITKVLEEQTLNEAATQELARFADEYGGFEGMKAAIIQLQNIVTDIEAYYDKTREKIQKVYDTLGDIRNEEGLKVGGFLAPSIESAFNKDLRPVTKKGFTKGLDTPKVRVISQADIDAHNSGERPLAETEPAKETVYTPNI